MVRAYLLSLLVRQRLALKDQFPKRYPHPWLVWEPGIWHVPPSARAQSNSATRLPLSQGPDQPAQGDALCFELAPPSNKPHWEVGRQPANDIVINDSTVSRRHLLLHRNSSGDWWMTVNPQATLTLYAGNELSPGTEVQLRTGEAFKAGNVRLTFYDTEGLLKRLEAEAQRLGR
jgi:hypothetical protein